MHKRHSILASLFIVLLVVGCTPASQQTGTYTPTRSFDPSQELQPRTFSSESELRSFISQYAGHSYYGGVMMRESVATSAVAPVAADAQKSESAAGGSSNSFSETNNQVAGVDEADTIKTDGEYIYTVSGETLFIIKAYPGKDAEVVSTIDLPGSPSGLFVEGDRLAVFGNFYDKDYFAAHDFRPLNGMTYINTYDITNRTKPVVADEYKVEGSYFNGRMKDGKLYILVQSSPNDVYPMPLVFENNVKRSVPVSDVAYFPIPYNYPQFVTIHSVPIGGGELKSKTLTVEGGNTLYMSGNSIYLAYTESVNEWELRNQIMMDVLDPQLSVEEKSRIEKIKAADPDVLSTAEKDSKVLQVYQEYFQYLPDAQQQTLNKEIDKRLKAKLDEYDAFEYTVIHRIHVDDLSVEATGKVPGHLNNQFAMDEKDSYLRVATTESQRWNWWGLTEEPIPADIGGGTGASEGAADGNATAVAPSEPAGKMAIMPTRPTSDSHNNVYVLDSDLKVVGKLEDLAKGEQIYSTRFIGDRLYMVTFRQVDPFFVIDLSEPSKPAMLGQLKIPGFSRYLHPYDNNTLIGIGRDATDMGQQQGLKIALFDVSDVSKPKELARWVSDEQYAQSTAEWEHKAFLFDREKELLVIPAYSYSWDYKDGSKEQYNGAMVFRVTKDDIEMRGIIDHSLNSQQYWGQMVERSLFIDNELYTKSPQLLRINELSDLSSVKNVTLSGKNASPYPIY